MPASSVDWNRYDLAAHSRTRGITEWGDYAERLAAQSVVWEARGWTWFKSDEIGWVAAENGSD